MISLSSRPPDITKHRFNVMLAMFAFASQRAQGERSVLCRVLDGRELEGVDPADEALLTRDEREHYLELKNEKTRALSIRTRAELRRMLGRELGLDPREVPLFPDAYGKPRCPHASAAGMDFSVSHADECALIAVGEAAAIGVDVEGIIRDEPEDEMLDIIFDQSEKEHWRSLPEEMHRKAFTQAWTIKEAALKAHGTGLYGSPHSVTVKFDAQGNALPVFKSPFWMYERINVCDCYAASFLALIPDDGIIRHVPSMVV
jgi:4'-phosphopantetheinyl transferase